VGERWCACAAVEFLGIVAHELGEYAEAEHCLEQALSRAHELGDTFLIAHIQSYYCRTLLVLGKFAQAEKSSQQSLALAREIGYRAGQALALDALGQVAYARASHAEARQFYVAGASLCSEIGATLPLTRILCHQGVNSLALGDSKHAQEAFLTALQTARQDDLVASALAALAGIALLLADNKSGELSLEIALYVLEHPVSTKEARNLVAPLRVRLESCLAPEQMQAAGKRARSRTLDEIASWALTGMNTVSPQTFMPSDI